VEVGAVEADAVEVGELEVGAEEDSRRRIVALSVSVTLENWIN
jgi:hypothetical protein